MEEIARFASLLFAARSIAGRRGVFRVAGFEILGEGWLCVQRAFHDDGASFVGG